MYQKEDLSGKLPYMVEAIRTDYWVFAPLQIKIDLLQWSRRYRLTLARTGLYSLLSILTTSSSRRIAIGCRLHTKDLTCLTFEIYIWPCDVIIQDIPEKKNEQNPARIEWINEILTAGKPQWGGGKVVYVLYSSNVSRHPLCPRQCSFSCIFGFLADPARIESLPCQMYLCCDID